MRRVLGHAIGLGLALFLLPGATSARAVVRVNEAVVGTESDSGRDVGIQLKSYLASEHLELRGGVFAGFRAPPGGGGAGSRNSPLSVGRVVYNFLDTEKGYISVGTNLGKRKILAIGAGQTPRAAIAPTAAIS